jgi:hypothetical protein
VHPDRDHLPAVDPLTYPVTLTIENEDRKPSAVQQVQILQIIGKFFTIARGEEHEQLLPKIQDTALTMRARVG